jgi:hypothetical protein
MLRKLFGFLSWQMTLLVALALWGLSALSLAAAQAINPFENNVFAFFADPVLFATTVTALAGWLTELVTDALKDRKVEMRGWHTRLIAGGVAAVLAGVGGFFGLSYFTGLTGVEGAYTAAGMALGSWLFADVKHRAGQLRKTGLRKEDRKALSEGVSDSVLEGLVFAGKMLPPPFNLAEPVIRNLYAQFGADYVGALIDQQRAMSEAEIKADQDEWEKTNARPAGARVLPTESAPTQGGAL